VSDSPPSHPQRSHDGGGSRRRKNRRGGRNRYPGSAPQVPRPESADANPADIDDDSAEGDLTRPSARQASPGMKLGKAQVPGLPWLYAELHVAERQAVIDTLSKHGVTITDEMADEVIQAVDETISPVWAGKKFQEIRNQPSRERRAEPKAMPIEPEMETLPPEPPALEEIESMDEPSDDFIEPMPDVEALEPVPRELTPEARLLEEFLGRMEYPAALPVSEPETSSESDKPKSESKPAKHGASAKKRTSPTRLPAKAPKKSAPRKKSSGS
jgi:hypothetical protein